ncbi:hypothetical protein KKD80_03755 [Patescibacteria group bacterium]|nr:hypothetical protein [Patescibacteria group bacterium]
MPEVQELGGGWQWNPETRQLERADGKFFAVRVGEVGPEGGKKWIQPLVLQEGGDPDKVIGAVTLKVCGTKIKVVRPWRPGAGKEVLEADRSSVSKGEVPAVEPIGYFRPDSARMTGKVGVVVVRLHAEDGGNWMGLADFIYETEDGMALAALCKAGL